MDTLPHGQCAPLVGRAAEMDALRNFAHLLNLENHHE